MPSPRPESGTPIAIPPGVALVPEDFRQKLEIIKRLTGLSWEGLATAMGVDSRQLWRWRKRGGEPGAGAMLALARISLRVPGGLALLLDEDVIVILGTKEVET
ncbi:MAG: hypothetical protein F4236_08365 [Acidimicrobiia bacterium]|nr:helix-turn-helix domain containing protein [Chloroflexota bacterium]MXZ34278.1 hypothetical protein [Acidobacteriota bacterium]MYE68129.1 hypothetical protein [Acidimicrobiia bacterium]